ncbi:MAG: protease inhibitor I42 family protein [Methanosarcina sp.]|jgi:inhibitor of cysteine peptidase
MSKTVPGVTILIICLILAAIPTAVYAKPYAASQHMITEDDNGKTISIKEGQTFILKLNENPSTGYSWQLSGLNDGLNLLRDEYHPWDSSEESRNAVLGAGGFHSWKIEAMSDGQVTATYKRPWEQSGVRTFRLDIVVV